MSSPAIYYQKMKQEPLNEKGDLFILFFYNFAFWIFACFSFKDVQIFMTLLYIYIFLIFKNTYRKIAMALFIFSSISLAKIICSTQSFEIY